MPIISQQKYIFNGMNIHLPAILGFTRYQGFDPLPDGTWIIHESIVRLQYWQKLQQLQQLKQLQ